MLRQKVVTDKEVICDRCLENCTHQYFELNSKVEYIYDDKSQGFNNDMQLHFCFDCQYKLVTQQTNYNTKN